MAFSRQFLKTWGLTDEQVSAIMEEHVSVTDALKKQRDEYKADADKLPEVQKQLDGMKGGEDYKAKYEEEHRALEDFKAEIKAKENRSKLEEQVREIAKGVGLSENGIQKAVKYTDYSNLALDADGKIKTADELGKALKEEWAGYVSTVRTVHEKVATPPVSTGNAKMTKEEIFAIKDTATRQKAIAENHELFGF